jgi:subtilisin family serine protease
VKRLLTALAVALLVGVPAAQATPGDPYAPQYYFDQWHLHALWAAGARGQGVTIAEIDTGVDAALPEFTGRVASGTDFGRLGGDGRIDRDRDPYGHGTSMASIMVGRPGQFGIQGVAPDATLVPVAIPLAGTTDAQSDDRLPEAIRWAADHGAKIISMSLGGVRRHSFNRTACPDDEQQAIYHALREGAILFAAGGNRGAGDNAVEEPGVCLGVVSVGAVDRTGAVAAFSSRHPYLTMTAPGVNIASIGPGGAPFTGDGTSQATAIASAAAALVWSKYPALSGSQVVARLLATLDGRTPRPDPAYGYGRLDAYQAVRAAVPANAPDPVATLVRPFLNQHVAVSRPVQAPAPVEHGANPPGTFTVGSAPRLFQPRVLVAAGVAAGGLVALLLLAALSWAGRRRRRFATVTVTPLAEDQPGRHDEQHQVPRPPGPSAHT